MLGVEDAILAGCCDHRSPIRRFKKHGGRAPLDIVFERICGKKKMILNFERGRVHRKQGSSPKPSIRILTACARGHIKSVGGGIDRRSGPYAAADLLVALRIRR